MAKKERRIFDSAGNLINHYTEVGSVYDGEKSISGRLLKSCSFDQLDNLCNGLTTELDGIYEVLPGGGLCIVQEHNQVYISYRLIEEGEINQVHSDGKPHIYSRSIGLIVEGHPEIGKPKPQPSMGWSKWKESSDYSLVYDEIGKQLVLKNGEDIVSQLPYFTRDDAEEMIHQKFHKVYFYKFVENQAASQSATTFGILVYDKRKKRFLIERQDTGSPSYVDSPINNDPSYYGDIAIYAPKPKEGEIAEKPRVFIILPDGLSEINSSNILD